MQQTLPLSWRADLIGEVDVRYKDAFEADPNYLPDTRAPSATTVDVSLTYRPANRKWSVMAYADNLADAVNIAHIQSNLAYSAAPISAAVLDPPRTFGLRANARF